MERRCPAEGVSLASSPSFCRYHCRISSRRCSMSFSSWLNSFLSCRIWLCHSASRERSSATASSCSRRARAKSCSRACSSSAAAGRRWDSGATSSSSLSSRTEMGPWSISIIRFVCPTEIRSPLPSRPAPAGRPLTRMENVGASLRSRKPPSQLVSRATTGGSPVPGSRRSQPGTLPMRKPLSGTSRTAEAPEPGFTWRRTGGRESRLIEQDRSSGVFSEATAMWQDGEQEPCFGARGGTIPGPDWTSSADFLEDRLQKLALWKNELS